MHIILQSTLHPDQCLVAFARLQQQAPAFTGIWLEGGLPTLLLMVEAEDDAYYLAIDFKPGGELLLRTEPASEPFSLAHARDLLQQILAWLAQLDAGLRLIRHTLGQAYAHP